MCDSVVLTDGGAVVLVVVVRDWGDERGCNDILSDAHRLRFETAGSFEMLLRKPFLPRSYCSDFACVDPTRALTRQLGAVQGSHAGNHKMSHRPSKHFGLTTFLPPTPTPLDHPVGRPNASCTLNLPPPPQQRRWLPCFNDEDSIVGGL